MTNQIRTEIIGVTPRELKESIINDVRDELAALAKNLKLFDKQSEVYLTRKEVSKILKVSTVTLSDWDKKGITQPYRLGNLIRYKKSELEKAMVQINQN